MLDRDQHRIHEDYVSDDQYQDSDEDLPFGFHLTFQYGPQYNVEEPYRAPWHKDKAVELLEEEDYDSLVDWAAEDY
jgi:hypothetical protein